MKNKEALKNKGCPILGFKTLSFNRLNNHIESNLYVKHEDDFYIRNLIMRHQQIQALKSWLPQKRKLGHIPRICIETTEEFCNNFYAFEVDLLSTIKNISFD